MMTNVETGEVDYALTQVACAKAIGCSKQLVSQVLSQKEMFKYFKTAKGWKLEYIDFFEHFYNTLPTKKLNRNKHMKRMQQFDLKEVDA